MDIYKNIISIGTGAINNTIYIWKICLPNVSHVIHVSMFYRFSTCGNQSRFLIIMAQFIYDRMRPANKRRHYIVTSPLIGLAHTQNDPWIGRSSFLSVMATSLVGGKYITWQEQRQNHHSNISHWVIYKATRYEGIVRTRWYTRDMFTTNSGQSWKLQISSKLYMGECQTKTCRTWISNMVYGRQFQNGVLAPVPLSIFRSNSKFDENSKHSNVKYTLPITTIFCTCHDSVTVVTCAKYRCDRSRIFETRAFWIFIEFRIRSKYA